MLYLMIHQLLIYLIISSSKLRCFIVARYIIVKCGKCGNFVAVKESSKAFRCLYCGTRNVIVDDFGRKRVKVYAVVDGREVPKVLAELKRFEKS